MKREARRGLVAGLLMTLLGLLVAPTSARAGIFFGDIAGNQQFSGYFVGGSGLNGSFAQGFSMTNTYNLTSVDLILNNYTATAGSSLVLSIYSNNGSNDPGTDLYDLSTNVTGPSGPTSSVVSFSGTGSFTLAAGTKYWLDLYSTAPTANIATQVEWIGVLNSGFGFVNPSGVGATDMGQIRRVGGNPPTGSPNPNELLRTGFELNGTVVSAVPEPASLVMLAIGGLGAAAFARTRRVRATHG
jgi:hypothetical protein